MSSKSIKIVLTDRAPVRINPEKWEVIASAKDWDNTYESQANRTWQLKVRRHADGRVLVYGTYTTAWQNESDREGGELLTPPLDGDGVDNRRRDQARGRLPRLRPLSSRRVHRRSAGGRAHLRPLPKRSRPGPRGPGRKFRNERKKK